MGCWTLPTRVSISPHLRSLRALCGPWDMSLFAWCGKLVCLNISGITDFSLGRFWAVSNINGIWLTRWPQESCLCLHPQSEAIILIIQNQNNPPLPSSIFYGLCSTETCLFVERSLHLNLVWWGLLRAEEHDLLKNQSVKTSKQTSKTSAIVQRNVK